MVTFILHNQKCINRTADKVYGKVTVVKNKRRFESLTALLQAGVYMLWKRKTDVSRGSTVCLGKTVARCGGP